MEIVVGLTAIAVAILIGFGALGVGIGMGPWAAASSKGARGSRNWRLCCKLKCSWSWPLLDAVAMIGVGIALFFAFANPFVGQLQAALAG